MVIGFALADAEDALVTWHDGVDIDRAPEPSEEVDIGLLIVRAQSVTWICDDGAFDDVQDPPYPLITLGLGTIVPDVVGEPLAQARNLLRVQGLVPGGADAEGIVDAQDPRAGETVDLGTVVTLQTPAGGGGSPGPSRIAVPAIVGLTPEAAREAVEGAGLVFEGVREGDGTDVGRVIAQEPPEGRLVRRGTEVTATIEMIDLAPAADTSPLRSSLPILIGLVVGILLATLVSSFVRSRRRHRSRRDPITFEARPDVGRVSLSEDVHGGRSFAFGLHPRPGATWSELEEEEEVLS